MKQIHDMFSGRLVVLSGHKAMQLTNDQAAEFLQEANFWYLTHIEEPGWRVIIDGLRKHVALVRPDIDEVQRIFDGGIGDNEAKNLSGADEIIADKDKFTLSEIESKLALLYVQKNVNFDEEEEVDSTPLTTFSLDDETIAEDADPMLSALREAQNY